MSERRQSKRKSKSPYSRRAFSSPVSRAVSPPSLSPEGSGARTDRVLTFLQSAHDRNVPVRFGKWSKEEDAYLTKLISLFKDGLLADMEPMSLRCFLALMLNCCPMRISKKQMHGHAFIGKTKYVRRSHKMTQEQYDKLCHEVWTLRDEFLKAWAKEEYARRSSRLKKQDVVSLQDWYDELVQLVPTPKILKPSNLKDCKKRRIEPLDELKTQVQTAKRQELEVAAKIGPVVEQEQVHEPLVEPLEPEEILPLEPALLPLSTATTEDAVVPLPTAYCSDTLLLGDWLTASERGCASAHCGEARYTYCKDKVQVSVHLADQQALMAELSMTRRSSRLVIDFGAPSCWHSDEEVKPSPYSDYMQWSENDLTGELALAMEPGIFDMDDFALMRHSPPLSFL